MILCGFGTLERILVHEANDMDTQHYIDLAMSKDNPTFMVTCCCDEDWFYEFMYSKSDYERVKFAIMEFVFDCDTMEELIASLTELFEDGFEEIVINSSNAQDEDVECDGDCAHCDFCE